MNRNGNRHDAADFALVLTVNFTKKNFYFNSIFNKNSWVNFMVFFQNQYHLQ